LPRQPICKPPQFFESLVDPLTELAAEPDVAPVVSIHVLRVRRAIRRLPALERRVLSWRYGLDGLRLTLAEIAQQLGVSVSTVHRIERRALATLRDPAPPEGSRRTAA
jgi:RNA polymerase sigma factor (sigma-70 family)